MTANKINFRIYATTKKWTVLYTKSRCEKKVAEYFTHVGVTNFLPLESRYNVYGGKKVRTSVPLFPGYVFICYDKSERPKVLASGYIARIIPVVDQGALVNDLEKIAMAQNAGMDLVPCPHYKIGQAVSIISGPLAGFDGIVQEIKDNTRLVLSVDFIRQSVSTDIDIAAVRFK